MLRPLRFTAIALAIISIGIGGCGDGMSSSVKIDDHVFSVPKQYLLRGTIPWLPLSQSNGLKFVMNPGTPPEEQILVTMEAKEKTCHPNTAPASNHLAFACLAASKHGRGSNAGEHLLLERVHRDGDITQWEYRMKGTDIVVASCYALSDDGRSGLCTSLYHFKDLVYSISLRDSDVKNLAAIRARVNALLGAWENAPGQ